MMKAVDRLLDSIGNRLFRRAGGERPPYDLYFWLILAVAVFARFNRLGHELMADETFNWFVAKDGVWTAVERINEDFFPPLYSALLAVWLKLTNETPMFIRLPSMVFGTATVYFIYRLAYLINGATLARLSIALLALNPIHIFWSQNARPFAMSALLVTLVLFIGYKIVISETSMQRPSLLSRESLGLALLCAALTTNTELIFVFVSFFFFAGVMYARLRQEAFAPIFRLGLVYFTVFLLWLPQLPTLLQQSEASVLNDFPFHNAQWGSTLPELAEFFGLMAIWRFEWLQYSLHGIFFAVGIWYSVMGKSIPMRLTVLFGVLYPAIMLLLWVSDPVFGQVVRRSIWLGPIWQIFVATGLISLSHWLINNYGRRFRKQIQYVLIGFGFFVFLLHGWSIGAMQRNSVDFWADVASHLHDRLQAGDIIAPIPSLQYTSYAYYLAAATGEGRVYHPRPFYVWHSKNIPDYLSYLCQRYSDKKTKRFWITDETDGVYLSVVREIGWQPEDVYPLLNNGRFLYSYQTERVCGH